MHTCKHSPLYSERAIACGLMNLKMEFPVASQIFRPADRQANDVNKQMDISVLVCFMSGRRAL